MEYRTGLGYDIHRLEEGLGLTLGGVEIPHHKGCVAHSDGDVILHALCDAILGALALGDIGKHFPDTDDEYLGISSLILLERVMQMVRQKGWRFVNADIMLLLQKPKIQPYVQTMRENIAAVIPCPTDRISIKATTTEGLGPIGHEEGVSAFATVLLERE
ncbi:MAG: 2-C-methyl-D-erythritol 2,4-cyclodiphosphate synthase [Bacteroidales bacterium]|nr:2-C-methyl-D-erythritol 2,4-cyclodiphosphate synthase [Bacteroidales bacterium]